MGTTADKLNKLLETKAAIKQAIIDKGVDISDTDTFASYPEKIESIQAGGGDDWLDIITDGGTRGVYLFNDCSNLTSLDLSSFDTSNVTNMSYMFKGCSNLTSLDLSSFDTSNVTSMISMFDGCRKISSLDLSSFDTSNVTNMSYMFSYVGYISSTETVLDLSSFDTSNVTNMRSMFSKCSNLTSLDLSNFDTSKVMNMASMFDGCSELVDFYPPQNINTNMSVSSSKALSHDSLVRIINNLMETASTKTLTLGTTNLAKLSDEEKAVATNKGWTLA
jgi:surface protein